MLYIEKEKQMGNYWYSFCFNNLGKHYSQWLVPCRLLDITPAEFVELLIKEYHAIVKYYPEIGFMTHCWASHVDESRWRNYINKVAREKGFQV